jgi:hypothetical protein
MMGEKRASMAATTHILRRRFYEELGKFAAIWASMEAAIDILAIVTARAAEKPPPHNLDPKINFIRKHVPIHATAETAKKLIDTLDRIAALAETRHTLIHGAAFAEERNGVSFVVKFGTLLQPRNKTRRPTVAFTAEQIKELTNRVFDLQGELLDFAEAVRDQR